MKFGAPAGCRRTGRQGWRRSETVSERRPLAGWGAGRWPASCAGEPPAHQPPSRRRSESGGEGLNRPIVWAIGGSDSGGGAGLQADIRTIHALGAHACTIVTAVTAQSSRGVDGVWPAPLDAVEAQWRALASDLPPSAIKIGMVPTAEHVRLLASLLRSVDAPVILDPVLRATAGGALGDASIRELLPLACVVTPNLEEARQLEPSAAKTVVIKGGHAGGPLAQDRITHDGRTSWLNHERLPSRNTHGTGCTFASATAAAMASGLGVVDALVVAKMFVTGAIRASYVAGAGAGPLSQGGWPEEEADLPWLTRSADAARPAFPRLGRPLGLYAIVDSADWVARLAGTGVGAIQLRIKSLRDEALRREIARAIRVAREAGVPLFINDYWRDAIALGAFGVHLGQEDLDTADVRAIESAGLRLGVSTHCYEEVARAHALRPSYIAIGPVFETKIKVMKFAPQGIAALRRWRRTLASYPLVAIGGIDASTIAEVAATGVDSVAVIRAITLAADPLQSVRELARHVAS